MSVSCFRFYGHGRMDKSPYRSAEEEEVGRKRDPLGLARTRLLERSLATSPELKSVDDAIVAEMQASIKFTAEAAPPDLTSMFQDVYAVGEVPPEPLSRRINRVLARS
jgi:pyruvate dehydrogenase E1 component alpha subunit